VNARLPTFAPIDANYSNADELFRTSNDHPSWRYLSHCDAAKVARKWRKSKEQSTDSTGHRMLCVCVWCGCGCVWVGVCVGVGVGVGGCVRVCGCMCGVVFGCLGGCYLN
jgi:hypothetical protein